MILHRTQQQTFSLPRRPCKHPLCTKDICSLRFPELATVAAMVGRGEAYQAGPKCKVVFRTDVVHQECEGEVRLGICYGRHSKAAIDLIKTKCPGKDISFSEIKDPGVTGNFEIKVNGALVHSKKTAGHGFLHNCAAAQQSAVLDAISKA
eukprot:s526_g32.t1